MEEGTWTRASRCANARWRALLATLAVATGACDRTAAVDWGSRQQALELPALGTTSAAGSLPGEAHVTGGGALSYEIPLALPPGRAGVQPSLGIAYSSMAGESDLGIGFALTGLSAIERCARTMAQDGLRAGVALDKSDRFCLDGSRLVATPGQDYGAPDTTYRTEQETWQRVTTLSVDMLGLRGPTGFVVTDAHGGERHYGTTVDSRLLIPTEEGLVVQSWLLSEQRDAAGNTITYEYEQVEAEPPRRPLGDWSSLPRRASVHIARIDYTGFVRGDRREPGTRSVRFFYAAKPVARDVGGGEGDVPDAPEQFVAGTYGLAPAALPMTHIRTFVEERLVHEYRLKGRTDNPAHARQLEEIQLCAAGAARTERDADLDESGRPTGLVCLPPTRFHFRAREQRASAPKDPRFGHATFEDYLIDFDLAPRRAPPPCYEVTGDCPYDESPFVTLDVDGNGADDILYERRGDGAMTLRFGKPAARDTAYLRSDADVPYREVHLPRVTASREVLRRLPAGLELDKVLRDVESHDILDWNSDGRDDVAVRASTGDLLILESTGRDFVVRFSGIRLPTWAGTPEGPAVARKLEFVDLDGDGRRDVLACQFDAPTFNMHFYGVPHGLRGARPDGARSHWAFAMRTNTGFSDLIVTDVKTECAFEYGKALASVASFAPWTEPNPFVHQPVRGDFDGDGLEELLIAPDYETGFGHRILRWDPQTASLTQVPALLGYTGNLRAADLNGDGLHDVFAPHKVGQPAAPTDVATVVSLSTGKGFTPPEQVALDLGGRAAVRRRVPPGDESSTRIPLDVLSFDLNGDGRGDLLYNTLPADAMVPRRVESTPFDWYYQWQQGQFWSVELASNLFPAEFPTSTQPRGVRAGDGPRASDVTLATRYFPVDADGDAALDLLEVVMVDPNQDERYGSWPLKFWLNIRAETPLIDRIENGHGEVTRVEYRPLSDPATYRPGTDCRYPQRCETSSRHVVSRLLRDAGEVAAGEESEREERHFYEDSRVDLRGRGALGFGRHVITRGGGAIVSEVLQDNRTFDAASASYPFAGRPARIWSFQKNAPLADAPESTAFTGILQEYGYELIRHDDAGTRATLEKSRSEARYESMRLPADMLTAHRSLPPLSTSWMRVTARDAFDHATAIEVRSPRGDVTDMTRRFLNDERWWRLGLLEEETVRVRTAEVDCPQESRTLLSYDVARARPTSITFQPGDPDASSVLTTTYDRYGNATMVETSTSAHGVRHHMISYDAERYFPTGYTNNLGHRSGVRFEPTMGLPVHSTDPAGTESATQYDGFGRPRLQRREGEADVELIYSGVSGPGRHAIETLSRTGGQRWKRFDRLQRLVQTIERRTDGDYSSEVEYDTWGRVMAVTEPHRMERPAAARTRYVYDDLGALRRVDGAIPGERTDLWHAPLRRFSQQPGGGVHTTELDVAGRVAAEVEVAPEGGRTAYQYCASGEVRRVIDAAGAVREIRYDPTGRRVGLVDPAAGSESYRLNPWGQIIRTVREGGIVVEHAYDAIGRPKSRTETTGDGVVREFTWIWDSATNDAGELMIGALDQATSSDGVIDAYAYDEHGRVQTLSRQVGAEVLKLSIKRDALGRVSRMTYPAVDGTDAFEIQYEYDPYGPLIRVSSGEMTFWSLEEADPHGLPTQEMLGPIVRTTKRSETGRIEGIQSQTSAEKLQALEYEYDARGFLKAQRDLLAGRMETFQYDRLGRLRNVTENGRGITQWYGVDTLGNLRSSHNSRLRYDDLSHPSWVTSLQTDRGLENVEHDAAGRIVTRGSMRFTWNADNLPRLIETSRTAAVFSYGPWGDRARKASDSDTLYLADLYQRERAGSQVAERFHVRGPEGVVATVERTISSKASGYSSQVRWNLTDRLGSLETSWREAEAPEHLRYDAFGAVSSATRTPGASSDSLSFGFTGHEHDEELGLINMEGRIYDPALRRFLTPDPLSVTPWGQGLNRYSYVHNNPINFVDPSGFQEAGAGTGSGDFHDFADEPTHFTCDGMKKCWETGTESASAGADGSGERAGAAASGSATGDKPFHPLMVQFAQSAPVERTPRAVRARLSEEGARPGEQVMIGHSAEGRPVIAVDCTVAHTCRGDGRDLEAISMPAAVLYYELAGQYGRRDEAILQSMAEFAVGGLEEVLAPVVREVGGRLLRAGRDIVSDTRGALRLGAGETAEHAVVNSAGEEVTRTLVPDEDGLLRAAESHAGGSLDRFREYKPDWWESPDGNTRIEFNLRGHPHMGEGPHVSVREFDGRRHVMVAKYFIAGRETL